MDPKRIVVIGGSGFLGSHVADALTDAGYLVTIFDIRASQYLRPGQTMVIGDIMDKESVRSVVEGAYAVYDFAGIADLKQASENPYETIQFNTLGVIAVLQACVEAGVQRFVFASSLYVYSQAGSFYRISKLASELIIEEFQKKFGLNFTILRFGSLYGSRADLRNGIYRFVHQAFHERRIDYYGTENDRREYIHVSEAAKLSVRILDQEFVNQHVVLSGVQALTAQQLLALISEILGGGVQIEIHPPKSFINYSISPYTFTPRLGRKLISSDLTDIGEGILRLVEEIHAEKYSDQCEDIATGPVLE